MARQEWSDQRKAEALAALDANGGIVSRTAKQLGIPRTTLIEWRDADQSGGVSEGVSEIRQGKKEELAVRLEGIAHSILDALPGKIGKASMKDAATGLGIVLDKRQLLLGQPTNIQRNEDLTPDERASRVAELLERGENRRGPAVPDGRGAGGTRPAAGRAN